MNLLENINLDDYLTEIDYSEIKPSSDYFQDTLAALYPPEGAVRHPGSLWQKCRGKVEFRPCEVSLWAGINGHGKSMMLSQIILDLLTQKQKVLVISLEMTPEKQLIRMATQAYAGKPTEAQLGKFFSSRATENLYIYNQTGSAIWQKVIAVCRYAQDKFGIQHIIIDNLMKIVRGEDDYNGQKDFINEACSFAMNRNCHMHIVHHVRKTENEYKTPDKFDIRGASSLVDQVDNVYIVFRHKKNEEANRANIGGSATPTSYLSVIKNRHGDFEGSFAFWFDEESKQYLEDGRMKPLPYNLA